MPALPAPRTATTGRGALLAAQGRVHEGLPRQSRSRTVEELGASFLAAVRSEIKTRTYETYESRIRNYIVPALGSKKVAHLATEDIRAFKRYLLSFKVVSNRTMAVSTILSTTRWTGKTAGNTGGSFDPWPRRRSNWPDERERPVPNTYLPYTIEEARRFVLATPQAFRPQILCAILLMLRDGELRAMRWLHDAQSASGAG